MGIQTGANYHAKLQKLFFGGQCKGTARLIITRKSENCKWDGVAPSVAVNQSEQIFLRKILRKALGQNVGCGVARSTHQNSILRVKVQYLIDGCI